MRNATPKTCPPRPRPRRCQAGMHESSPTHWLQLLAHSSCLLQNVAIDGPTPFLTLNPELRTLSGPVGHSASPGSDRDQSLFISAAVYIDSWRAYWVEASSTSHRAYRDTTSLSFRFAFRHSSLVSALYLFTL